MAPLSQLTRTALIAVTILAGTVLTGTQSALADFRMCNRTGGMVGVAIGYRDEKNWVTEGWWNLPPDQCETLIPGPLNSRFYYIYAIDYDQGGEWSGKAFMCTREKKFTINGINECVARGFERTGFFEIDTGEQRTWTVQLTEPTQAGTVSR